MSELSNAAHKIVSRSQLNQFHSQLILNSLHQQNYWVSQLISLCTRYHAPPAYTRSIFCSTHNPNVFVFTNLLKYHSQWSSQNAVFKLFYEMQKANIKADAFVYPLLIRSAGKDGIAFHAPVLKMGFHCDKYVCNSVMDFYGKYGPIEIARELFDEMPYRSIADWNSIISGYWNQGNQVEAKKFFSLTPEKNVVTWTAMVTGFSKTKDLDSARRYFDQMPEKSVVSWNAMISGYVQNGFAEEGINLFGKMVNAGIRPDETTWVGVISSCSSRGDPFLAASLVRMIDEKGIHLNSFAKTALIDMHAKCGNVEKAREIFDELSVHRNSVTWNAMISAYVRIGDLASARELFRQMPEKNVISWNTMIAGCQQNGQSAMAVEFFKEMSTNTDLKPDEVTMLSVISACGHLGALELGKWAVNFLTEKQIKLSISGLNSLIFMYSKCGSMKEAKTIFQNMETRDVISYNALITGFAAYGDGNEAVALLSKMSEEYIEPDRITYIGVLTACSHSGLISDGQKVFESIKAPDHDHYACMVDLYSRVGRLDEAKRLIDSMPMPPRAGVYGSILNASRLHKRTDLAEFAANKLFQIEPENPGNYVLLSNVYAALGRWEDVDRIRALMKHEGIQKTTGSSWVEHGGKLHKFIVGDRSHEMSLDIYQVLTDIQKRMKIAGYVADRSCVLQDVEEEEKEEMVGIHSEKLAVAFGILVSEPRSVIRVVKNLRICRDCHTAIKIISQLEQRKIIVRDNNRFHYFEDGMCSCKDYW